jgi:hypothetical protein
MSALPEPNPIACSLPRVPDRRSSRSSALIRWPPEPSAVVLALFDMSEPLPVVDAEIETLIPRAGGTTPATVPLVLNHGIVESDKVAMHSPQQLPLDRHTEPGRGIHVINAVLDGVSMGDVYVMASESDHTFPEGEKLLLHPIHFVPNTFDEQT